MKTTSKWRLIALALMLGASTSMAAVIDSVTFGSNNNGDGGFSAIQTASGADVLGTTTFVTTNAGNVSLRIQNTGTTEGGFIKQISGIDRTADSGKKYTVTGTVTINDGYADDNNRLGLILFSDPTEIASRNNLTQLSVYWNTDDNSRSGAPGANAPDNFGIVSGYAGALADAATPLVLRDQTIPFAQNILQGTEVTWSATFWFTGTDIKIDASMIDAGGVTTYGTATVLATDYTGDYFGFFNSYRARTYDGTPDPTGAARDNPLVMDYQTFSIEQIPEPSTFSMVAFMGGALFFIRRRVRISRRID